MIRSHLNKLCAIGTLLALGLAPFALAHAQIDHRLQEDRSGIYRAQNALPPALGLVAVAGALVEGSESRLGRTYWHSAEAFVITGAATQLVKHAMRRRSPAQTSDPRQWFAVDSERSFPSGHVSLTTAAVTPFIAAYRHEQPLVWLLAALPAYEMAARVKARAHWQTDVLAGAALGAAIGVYAQGRASPWTLTLSPGGVFVGYHAKLR